MRFALLAISVGLLSYAIAILVGTAIVALLFPRAARLSEPAARARRLFVLRIFPSLFAVLVVGGLVLPSFLRLEPRDTPERVSASMAALAGAGLLLLLAGPLRGLLSLLSTRRLLKRWQGNAVTIEAPGIALPAFAVNEAFPIVSLVGCFRPRLVVARSVLEACDGAELAAVLAHEAGHHQRRDSWARLLVRACPDLLSMTPWAGRLERSWAEAAEQDADERAARTGPTRALDLASALVKVARLAGAIRSPAIATAALYRGENVAARVARLLERDGRRALPARRGRLFAAAVGLLALLALVPALGLHHEVHGAIEVVVSFLQ